ncbi:hypothetical protein GUI51_14780 [Enterococcus mundtii]|uniref:WxL domain-containing protein n=1 Tax=Enterococcus mundtii TaxID=53346 RepID=A0ABQ0VG87_ENTMU|nr:hypothetical protein [Enterococcus mundtii]MZU11547.1 hypothetical protein [Bifidobacterium longum]GEN20372.1 hypothetical protein LAC02_36530 [Ligilactobacillus acidipiscis]AUB51753.1 hypothetical protein EM4838_01655 [Enterococcus mundtii]MDB7089003.1 hypothetical protein [Enterococcus mundtii]MZZ58846.1 hypothetical protein [Enterococcus mundtii]
MLNKKQLLATFMTTATLGQALINTTAVFADVAGPNETSVELTTKETTNIPFANLSSDRFGETITSLSIENNVLTGTKTNDHSSEIGFKAAYTVYGSDNPVFNIYTSTKVGNILVNPDDLTHIIGDDVSTYPEAQYYYIVDDSSFDYIPMVRINGEDLLNK